MESPPLSPRLPLIDYATHPAYGASLSPDPALGAKGTRLMRAALDQMRLLEEDRQARFGYRYNRSGPYGDILVDAGAVSLQSPATLIDRIDLEARRYVERIEARIRDFKARGEPIKFSVVEEPIPEADAPDIWAAVNELYRELGIFQATAAYYGAPDAKIKSMAVLVNQEGQGWASNIFRDETIPTPPTQGFHIDSNGKCFVKAVLYLSDVTAEQGPFGFVPGSHRWDEGTEARLVRRAFDRSGIVSRVQSKRRMFISLPPEWQLKAEFGGDMVPGAPETDDLVARESVAVGPRGQLNIFNPEVIHRGGSVTRGHRHVLLISCGVQW